MPCMKPIIENLGGGKFIMIGNTISFVILLISFDRFIFQISRQVVISRMVDNRGGSRRYLCQSDLPWLVPSYRFGVDTLILLYVVHIVEYEVALWGNLLTLAASQGGTTRQSCNRTTSFSTSILLNYQGKFNNSIAKEFNNCEISLNLF